MGGRSRKHLDAVTNGQILENGRLILAVRDFFFDESLHLGFFGAIKVRTLVQRRIAAADALHFIPDSFQGWFAGAISARHRCDKQ
jgi:hypothetical protein